MSIATLNRGTLHSTLRRRHGPRNCIVSCARKTDADAASKREFFVNGHGPMTSGIPSLSANCRATCGEGSVVRVERYRPEANIFRRMESCKALSDRSAPPTLPVNSPSQPPPTIPRALTSPRQQKSHHAGRRAFGCSVDSTLARVPPSHRGLWSSTQPTSSPAHVVDPPVYLVCR